MEDAEVEAAVYGNPATVGTLGVEAVAVTHVELVHAEGAAVALVYFYTGAVAVARGADAVSDTT